MASAIPDDKTCVVRTGRPSNVDAHLEHKSNETRLSFLRSSPRPILVLNVESNPSRCEWTDQRCHTQFRVFAFLLLANNSSDFNKHRDARSVGLPLEAIPG